MSTASIRDVMTELFTAPLEAAVAAERGYREAWAQWMKDQADLAKNNRNVSIPEILRDAPAVSLDGIVEMSVTMRIASVRQREGSVGLGVGLGPVHATGSFGFISKTAEESIFQAQAKFTLSNTDRNLTAVLAKSGLAPANLDDMDNAIKLLQTSSKQEASVQGTSK
jgi:hypothetical protein